MKKILLLLLSVIVLSEIVSSATITILENQITTQANLINITAEGNFTHLNISNTAPYDSLVGYWSFDGDKVNTELTTHYDFTKYNNDGTGVGNAVVNNTNCVYDDCLQLDGNGDYVNVGDKASLDMGTNNFSISVWIKGINEYSSAATNILSKGTNNVDGGYDLIVTQTFLYARIEQPGQAVVISQTAIAPFLTGTWQHVVVVYDRSDKMDIYRNGTEVSYVTQQSISGVGNIDTAHAFVIGSDSNGNPYFNGTIDEVMIFNTSLTSAQILDIYNNQSARFVTQGTQDIVNQSYMNITSGNNRVNVTTWIENILDSSINLSVGYYDGSWSDTSPQVVSSGVVQTFTITDTSTNLTLNYTFYAGNSSHPFYSPIIKNNITYEVWNEPSDTTPPGINFTSPTPSNATTQSATNVEINVSITESDLGEVKFNWNGTNHTMYNDSLVLMMNFDNRSSLEEDNTKVVDLSKYGNNGTHTGDSFINLSGGRYEGGLQVDGNGDYINVGDKASLDMGTNNFSISVWIKGINEYSSVIVNVLSKGANNVDGGYDLGVTSTSFYARIEQPGQAIVQTYTPVSPFLTGTWQHVVAVYDRSDKVHIYLNGTEVSYTAQPDISGVGNIDTAFAFVIASDSNGDPYFNGTIDEVRIYNQTLSATEIYELYVSNLYKFNQTQWYLYVNQSKNSTTGLSDGVYTYSASAKDISGNVNSTETRTITIGVDTTPPSFSNNQINASSTTYNGTTVQINLTITDDTAVDFYTLSHNDTAGGTWANESFTDAGDSASLTMIWNYSITNFPTTGGTMGWRVWANDTSNNINISNIYTFVVQSPTCTCPTSGNWIINDGSICTLSSTCNIGTNKLRIDSGGLLIQSGGYLRTGGCYVADSQRLFISNDGGLYCGNN